MMSDMMLGDNGDVMLVDNHDMLVCNDDSSVTPMTPNVTVSPDSSSPASARSIITDDDRDSTSSLSEPPSVVQTPVFGSTKQSDVDMKDVAMSLDRPPIPENIDSRIEPEALIWHEGQWVMPAGCNHCLQKRRFCSRGMPCKDCKALDRECVRKDGYKAIPGTGRLPRARAVRPVPEATPALHKRSLEEEEPIELVGSRNVAQELVAPLAIGDKLDEPSEVAVEPVLAAKKLAAPKRPAKKAKKDQVDIANLNASKPRGLRPPEVWAETRQELCEALPWYRAYQSGCYTHDNAVHGYLLDGSDSARDFIGGKVFVSHCGGKSEEDLVSGLRKLKCDQTKQDATVKALFNNMKLRTALPVIIGDRAKLCPSMVPARYCIMDWFKVTHAWAEKCEISGYCRYKYRFEILDYSRDGWWATEVSENKAYEIPEVTCSACNKPSPHIYEQGWMCLEKECDKWWKIDGENEPKSLSYTEAFMFAETVWPKAESAEPSPLKPTHNFDWDSMFKAYNRQSWKGFCCENCGRLSCRIYWDRFECANKDCKLAVVPKGRKSFVPEDLADGVKRTGPSIALNVAKDEIEVTKTNLDGYTVMQYKLGDAGTVTHMVANLPLNAVEFGADWLFQEYQQAKIPFMRHPMHTIHGLTRTAHFTYNVGAQYNYVTEQSTVSFEEAPPVVTKALELIKSNVKKIYPYVRFNEVLNVGYFEQQKMGFHQDGETGLGPTVASLSLGCPAKMLFRVKTSKKNKNADLDYPGTRLTLTLNHGDIMIMHGSEIQQIWEHAAIPTGLFRIAATARWIGRENHLTKAGGKPIICELPSEEVDPIYLADCGFEV